MVAPTQAENDAYRAIGRYLVEFSFLIGSMRDRIADVIAGDGRSDAYQLAHLALGSLTAQQVSDAFFAICREAGKLDDGEKDVEKWLRTRIDDEIRRRNRIAHGDWLVSEPAPHRPQERVAALIRVKASSKEPFITEELSVEQIDEYWYQASLMWQFVAAFGMACTRMPGDPPERVRDVLEIADGMVVYTEGHLERNPGAGG